MELTLKGEIKKLHATHGIVYSDDYKEDFFFLRSDVVSEIDRFKVKKNDQVSFALKTNRSGRSEAFKIALFVKKDRNKKKNILKDEKKFEYNHSIASVKEFQRFITEGFYKLETDNKELNELIKMVVRDNVITEVEKEFLEEKTLELNLPNNLLKKANDYLFSNNPYLDNILSLIFKDDVIKENELAFLYEKSNENEFTNSFVNNRFWQFAFTYNFQDLIKTESLIKIIKLWHLSKTSQFDLPLNKDWIILNLNIFRSKKIIENIDSALSIFEDRIKLFLTTKYDFENYEIQKIYNSISLEFEDKIKLINKNNEKDLTIGVEYKKSSIYSLFNVLESKQGGKWNNGYCEHNDDFFIFTNIGQGGHGYNKIAEFEYNNTLDDFGYLNWEAINTSKLNWKSVQKLKTSTPFIFIRTSKTKKHYWEYLGKGKCLFTLDTTPVKFKWEIIKEVSKDKKVEDSSLTNLEVNWDKKRIYDPTKMTKNPESKIENKAYWNEIFVPNEYKGKILKLISEEGIFEASQEYLNLAFDNGQKNPSKVMTEFEKIIETLNK